MQWRDALRRFSLYFFAEFGYEYPFSTLVICTLLRLATAVLILAILVSIWGVIFVNLERDNELRTNAKNWAVLESIAGCVDLRIPGKHHPAADCNTTELKVLLADAHAFLNASLQNTSHWTFSRTLFFVYSTVTTVGYGEVSPATDAGRIACIFLILTGVPIAAYAFSYAIVPFLWLYSKVYEFSSTVVSPPVPVELLRAPERSQSGATRRQLESPLLELAATEMVHQQGGEEGSDSGAVVEEDNINLGMDSAPQAVTCSSVSGFDTNVPARTVNPEAPVQRVSMSRSRRASVSADSFRRRKYFQLLQGSRGRNHRAFFTLLSMFSVGMVLLILLVVLWSIKSGENFSTAFYFVVVSASTVGFGDIRPPLHSDQQVATAFVTLTAALLIFGSLISTMTAWFQTFAELRHVESQFHFVEAGRDPKLPSRLIRSEP